MAERSGGRRERRARRAASLTLGAIALAVLSLIVMLGWQYFVAGPQMKTQQAKQAAIEDILRVLTAVALIFAIFTMSLDLLVGYAGLPSFGHAAFYGVGAYACALLALGHVDGLVPLPGNRARSRARLTRQEAGTSQRRARR